MNAIAKTDERSPSMNSVGMTTGNGTKIAPQNLGEVVRFAEVMARADIALPPHLRGNAGACMAVALQALEWQMSPFAVASKSYAVKGAIAYEAQLIAAVVNTRSGIKGRLKYQFNGEGAAMTCTVTGMLDGEECAYTSPAIGSITTKNSPLWKSDPQQQLGYFSARSWARRHVPEVILGVYDRDETESFQGPDNAKNITPSFDPLSDDEPVRQLERITEDGEIITEAEQNTPDDTPPLSGVAGEVEPGSLSQTHPADEADQPGDALAPPSEASSGSLSLTEDDKRNLKDFIIRLRAAVGSDPDVVKMARNSFAAEKRPLSQLAKAKAESITGFFRDVCTGDLEESTAIELAAGLAQIEESEVA